MPWLSPGRPADDGGRLQLAAKSALPNSRRVGAAPGRRNYAQLSNPPELSRVWLRVLAAIRVSRIHERAGTLARMLRCARSVKSGDHSIVSCWNWTAAMKQRSTAGKLGRIPKMNLTQQLAQIDAIIGGLLGLAGGAVTVLLWEVFLRPAREGRVVAEVLAAEVSYNLQYLVATIVRPNRRGIGADFKISTQVFDSTLDRLGFLPPQRASRALEHLGIPTPGSLSPLARSRLQSRLEQFL